MKSKHEGIKTVVIQNYIYLYAHAYHGKFQSSVQRPKIGSAWLF